MSQRPTRRQFLHRVARTGLGAAGLAILGGCAISPGQGVGGVPTARVATIGYLRAVTDEVAADEGYLLDALRQGLRELGWIEGVNLRLEVRLSQGDPAALPELAAELAHLPVDVIVAAGTAVYAATSATSTLPVVMANGPVDPVRAGLAASIPRPGGNVTGVVRTPSETFGKRLELLVEAVPHVARIAYIGSDPRPIRQALEETARPLGVQVGFWPVEREQTLDTALSAISRETADAVLVADGVITVNNRARIIRFTAQRQLPAMFEARQNAVDGGLLAYDADRAASFRRAAFYVDRILRGTNPGELPIEYPTLYELLINLRTAAALGLTIPDSLLAQATEVIR